MGGAVILLAGDFRQTLPVIQRSTPADGLNACLKYSYLWKYVKKITLSTNMRVHLLKDDSAKTFAQQLLDMGDGKIPVDPSTQEISFPQNFCQLQSSIEDLDNKVFPNIASNFKNHDWLCERAILAPKNDDVNKINDRIQLKIPGTFTEYKSIDTVTEENDAINYPVEFLNSLEPPEMPSHKLTLKIGSPILLLRNLNTPKLCNGTRLSIKKLMPNVIEATIIVGKYKGEDVLIPRIPIIPSDLPFTFKRLQFPIRLAFAMTINKAQGQSLQVTGLNLSSACFSHGQLYVACSRLGNPKFLYIYTPNKKTKNIVYPLALR
ncbi:ATP-dependent DNA helicase pif1-like [Cotesia typhae]|uniref:ATP-dependent DNA helicase pif1-like n=1 Tax=Cotesia typhae TaxID=2053667 RepID=UPI003D68AC94